MRNLINRTGRIVKRHPVLSLYFMAGAAYLAFTFYYLGGALTSCSTELLSFPGDHTAGLFDYYTVDNVDPWWGYTTFYSYPYGESLWQPYHIVSQVVFVPFWALAKLFGPVCGFNLLAALGFMITSLVTFGFVRWLLGRKELLYAIVAFLAGYAVAFWPYAQHKSGAHIAYVFAGILVASAWLFLKFWQKPRVLWAVLFGLSVAIFGYVDGYFILLGSVLVGGLLVGAYIYELVYKKTSLRDLWPRTKLLLLSGLVAALCLVPVAYVQWRYADQLNSALSSQRDAIGREAQEYGARPYDYLLPNPKHPLIPLFFGEDVRKRLVGINSERNIIGFSKVIAVLAIFMAVVVIYRWRKKQSLVQSALRWDPGFVLMVFGIVVLAAFSLSLAPRLGPIPTPTFLVIQVVEMWRVFARLSLVVNIGLVVLASYGLALLLKRFKLPRARWGVFVIVFALIFLEYMTFAWRPPTFGYREVPEFYTWLSQQKDVSEIAEYPLEEVSSSDYPMYYGTYRAVHGKKLLNGVIPTQDTGPLRAALRDLMSPQTVPTLRALGIDYVVVHSYKDPGYIPGLLLERTGGESLLDDRLTGQRGQVYGYRVLPGEEADYALVIGDGFHAPHKKSAIHVIQQMGHHGQLSVKRLPGRQSTQEIEVSWTSRSANEVAHLIEVRQEGVLLWSGVIGHEDVVIRFIADPNKPIDVMAVNPTTDATILLSNFSVN